MPMWFSIGDHETDARCALKANASLQANGSRIRVLSIGAFYSDHVDASGWTVKPDYEAKTVDDILKIANGKKNSAT
jgi:hypothetical protein